MEFSSSELHPIRTPIVAVPVHLYSTQTLSPYYPQLHLRVGIVGALATIHLANRTIIHTRNLRTHPKEVPLVSIVITSFT